MLLEHSKHMNNVSTFLTPFFKSTRPQWVSHLQSSFYRTLTKIGEIIRYKYRVYLSFFVFSMTLTLYRTVFSLVLISDTYTTYISSILTNLSPLVVVYTLFLSYTLDTLYFLITRIILKSSLTFSFTSSFKIYCKLNGTPFTYRLDILKVHKHTNSYLCLYILSVQSKPQFFVVVSVLFLQVYLYTDKVSRGYSPLLSC